MRLNRRTTSTGTFEAEVISVAERRRPSATAHLRRTFEIKRGDDIVATLRQGLLSIGDKFTIKLADGSQLKAKGDIIDYDFEVRRENDVVIHASHTLVSAHDTYGVQVMAGFPPDLAMAIMIALEQMVAQDRS